MTSFVWFITQATAEANNLAAVAAAKDKYMREMNQVGIFMCLLSWLVIVTCLYSYSSLHYREHQRILHIDKDTSSSNLWIVSS